MTSLKRKQPAGPLKLNVWQAEALAEIMRAHDRNTQAAKPDDGSLQSAYAEIAIIDEGNGVLTVKHEDGAYCAIWSDGTDCTDEYPELATR